MPSFLEDKLKKQYPNNPHAVFGTMNKIGAMRGNRETPKGAAMQAKHDANVKAEHPVKPKGPDAHYYAAHGLLPAVGAGKGVPETKSRFRYKASGEK